MFYLRQHRTIPALRLKHRSRGCGPGRALVGMEFESAEDRETVRKRMAGFSRNIIRAIREISPEAFHRIMGSR